MICCCCFEIVLKKSCNMDHLFLKNLEWFGNDLFFAFCKNRLILRISYIFTYSKINWFDETLKKGLRIAKFERFGKLDRFEKIWIDLKKLIWFEIESIGSRSRTEFSFSLVMGKNHFVRKTFKETNRYVQRQNK